MPTAMQLIAAIHLGMVKISTYTEEIRTMLINNGMKLIEGMATTAIEN